MKKQSFWRLLGLGAAAAAFTAPAAPAVAQQVEEADEAAATDAELADTQVILEVDGMSCPFCAYGLEKRFREIEAIDDLVIRVSEGLVQIRLKEGETLSDEALRRAVKQAGFSLREIRRRDT